MQDDFAVFICTHGRPNKQLTLNLLRKCGYTGKIYLVVDDTDSTIQEYIDNFGSDNVIVFDKNYYINSDRFDNCSNDPSYKCIVYAKRAVEDIAKSLGINFFAISDDDITRFALRYPVDGKVRRFPIVNFDKLLSVYLNMLDNDIAGIGFGHVTSYCGGVKSFDYESLSARYLPYQFILRNSKIDVSWTSWFAEDDVTELEEGKIGKLWLVIPYIMQETEPIGDISADGGMVDVYKQSNMFKLNFNVILHCPCGTSLMYKPHKSNRYVIMRRYNRCLPNLISGGYKK